MTGVTLSDRMGACRHGTEGAQLDPRICSVCSAVNVALERRRANDAVRERFRRDLSDLGVMLDAPAVSYLLDRADLDDELTAEIEGGPVDPELVEAKHRAWLRSTRVQAGLHVAATRKILRER